jgi:transcriptional regulator, tetR family
MSKKTDLSTQEKILEAARKLFIERGYAATTARDIAVEAGTNLALLNYHFKSKELLFQRVVQESMQTFFGVIAPVINNETMSLDEKLKTLIDNYIGLLLENLRMPMFIMHIIDSNPHFVGGLIDVREVLERSSLAGQIKEVNPLMDVRQFVTALLGMVIFPFMARSTIFKAKEFKAEMLKRKELIYKWGKMMLDSQ